MRAFSARGKIPVSMPFDCIILLCILHAVLAQGNQVGLLPRRDLHVSSLEVETTKVLREVFEGPLNGHEVTLLVEYEVQEMIEVDRLLSSLPIPIHLLLAPEDVFEEDLKQESRTLIVSKVVVGVVASGSSWALSFPPQWWHPEAIVLVVVSKTCDAHNLLETPLLETTASAAVLCPVFPSGDTQRPDFRVVTRMPYSVPDNLMSLGKWDPSSFSTWNQLFINRFRDFGGKTIHLASDYDDMPFIFHNGQEADGTNVRMMKAIGNWLNFTYTTTRSAPDSEWGERDENGTWSGLLGEIHREVKDMAINYFTVTEERAEDFDFSVPYYNEGFGLLVKKPPPLPRWRNLLFPFTSDVWVSMGGVLVISAVVFHIINIPTSNTSAVVNTITLLQGLAAQGLARVPKSWLVRRFLVFWWFMCWILDYSYTCNLIAVLTVPVYPKRITSVKELAFSDLRLCMLDYGEFVPGALATSSDPALSMLGAKTDLPPVIESLDYQNEEECVEYVLAGTHAHTETYSYAKLIYSELGHGASVYAMKSQLYENNLVFFFRKKTPWRSIFNIGISRLVESGLVEKWYKDIMDEKAGETEDRSSGLKSLTIGHLQGPFMMLGLGLLLALTVFIGECLAQHVFGPKRKSIHQSLKTETLIIY